MSHNQVQILEGAYIIGDAHYSSLRPELYYLIRDIHTQKILPTQLLLFGDIFDALFGNVPHTCENNQEMITMINEISQRIEVIYLEGNHDFNLKKIFPHSKVFTIKEQPVQAMYKDKSVLLAHGDFGEDIGYKIYTNFIRNRFVLSVFSAINNLLGNAILNKLDIYLSKKDDCNEFTGFLKYISKRIEKKYTFDYFIEGHFHQNKIINFDNSIYINLAAFACNQRYFIVESKNDKKILREYSFHKET